MMDQMLTELNPTQEFQDRMNRAADKFIKTMQGERTAKEILDVVVEYYAPRFTEAELDQLIAFYQSDVAKKDAEITRAAMDNVAARFKGADEKKQHEAVSEFMQDMRVIAADCRCQRQK